MSARNAVIAPIARAPQYGIVVAAPAIDDNQVRWGVDGGLEWEPEQCGVSARSAINCGLTDDVDLTGTPGIAGADAFVVWAIDRCSTFGYAARDWMGRARRQLDATVSFEIAEELDTGALGLDQPFLQGPTANEVTVVGDVHAAFASLDGFLVTCGEGRRGMIHVTPAVLNLLATNGTIRRDANLWLSAMGTIVVADAGYSGDGPAGAPHDADKSWLYATSMIYLRFGPIQTRPGNLDTALAEAVDRSVNTIEVRALQPVMYQFDACCHFAVKATVPESALAGS